MARRVVLKCDYRTTPFTKCGKPARWHAYEGRGSFLCGTHARAAKKLGLKMKKL